MSKLFDAFFGPSAKPLRREVRLRVTVDRDGNDVVEAMDGECVSISDDGSVDFANIEQLNFYHCGCPTIRPAGGQCAEPGCRRVSCERCARRCDSCLKPCCLEHIRQACTDTGATLHLCIGCFERAGRRRIARSVARALLGPFVNFEEKR